MKTVLVTGGAGFIGSHLVELILKKNCKVIVIDDLSTGRIKNLSSVLNEKNLELVIDTITNSRIIKNLIKSCDCVFHLAAAVGVKLIFDEPVRSIKTNICGTEIILDYSSRFDKKVIVVSSSEVYGKNEKVPFSEDDLRILGPTTTLRWSYSTAKALDEYLSLAYAKEKGLRVVVPRLFNTVGPRQTGMYGMVIPRFINQALNNLPITVYGDGSQKRCFTYVKEVVKILFDLMETKDAENQIINVGSQEEISILDLARLIKRKTNSNSPIEFKPFNQIYGNGFDDMMIRKPDITKLKNLLGYYPTTPLEDIIDEIILDIKKS